MAKLNRARKSAGKPRPLPPGTYTLTKVEVQIDLEAHPPYIRTTGEVQGVKIELLERIKQT
jgi:hypothetical protein